MPLKDLAKRREYRKRYHFLNRENIRAKARENRASESARRREHRHLHPEMVAATNKRFRLRHLEEIKLDRKVKYERNREKIRAQGLRKKFGMSIEEYERILESQNGLCAVCRHVCKTGNRLAVDHDHRTGQVRGLLCSSCNIIVGHLHDSRERLHRILSYLEVHAQLHLVKRDIV